MVTHWLLYVRPVGTWISDRVRGLIPGAGKSISVYRPPESTQLGHPSVGRRNEHQPKGGNALRLGSKGSVTGQVTLCLVYHGPYLSVFVMGSFRNRALYKCIILTLVSTDCGLKTKA